MVLTNGLPNQQNLRALGGLEGSDLFEAGSGLLVSGVLESWMDD